MQNSILMPDEKIINYRKPSILGEQKFWLGAIILAFSLVCFVIFSILYPQYNSTLSNIHNSFPILGIGSGVSPLNSIPLLPTILLIIGFGYLLYAEFEVYFKEFTITNMRIIFQHGVLVRDANIVLPRMVSDVLVDVSIIDRIIGLGKIIIRSTDAGRPDVVISGISEPYKFQDDIIKLVSKGPSTEAPTPPPPPSPPPVKEEKEDETNKDEDDGTGKTD